VKSKQLEVKLERVLERMEEQGQNTTDIQPVIDRFNAKIESARISYETALGKFKQAINEADAEKAKDLAGEGNGFMKEAQKSLQEAQKVLKEVIQKIKSDGGEIDAPEDAAQELAEA
ncbi:MAG TPA: hypothetical protein VFF28_02360, partial [Candidatus Nanoarchaeia archaeon]|nr:hypothetical protein [Candidatus Nanoarchaeia archaeon]